MFIEYAAETPKMPTTMPPSPGPMTVATWRNIVFSVRALASSSRGTRLGIMACRAGASKARVRPAVKA